MFRDPLCHFELSKRIIGSAIHVHQHLGPGLLEKAYQRCLSYHLRKVGLHVEEDVPLTLTFEELTVSRAYKIDMVVEQKVLVELKAIEKLSPIHIAQAVTYLKFSGLEAGLILNFNSLVLRDGLRRVFNNNSPR